MKEHPILFNSEMVLAILEGRKTQTRRIIKPQPQLYRFGDNHESLSFVSPATIPGYSAVGVDRVMETAEYLKCPFGKDGDRLWVREKFRYYNWLEECACYDDCNCSRQDGKPIYYADSFDNESKWKPSIRMPRKASRINLIIDEIRVERLQDITPEDCESEGITLTDGELKSCNGASKYRPKFRNIWNSIYGQWQGIYKRIDGKRQVVGFERYPWAEEDTPPKPAKALKLNLPCAVIANPWLWVIKFHKEGQ